LTAHLRQETENDSKTQVGEHSFLQGIHGPDAGLQLDTLY